MSKKIVFKISNSGDVSISEMHGYGSGCLDSSAILEKRLGVADESSRVITDEYNEPVTTDNSERIIH